MSFAQCVHVSKLAALPAGTEADPPYATEYTLVCVKFPSDEDDRVEAISALSVDTVNKKVLLNVEQRGPPPAVTLLDPVTNVDIGKVRLLRIIR